MQTFEKNQKVVVCTGDYFIWRPGGVFHPATVLAQTEYKVKVLFDEKRFGIFPVVAWLSKFDVETIQ